jgi:hypothetical protein
VSGKKNTFTASLYPTGKEKDVIFTADGQWIDTFQIKDAKSKVAIAMHDPQSTKTTPLTVAPVEEQDHFESRRAWKKVADAIVRGDMDTTSAEKSIIENRQREMRKNEKEAGQEWERKFFSRTDKFPTFERLAAKIGEKTNDTLTNGVWVFDQDKANAAKSPYHPSVEPPIYQQK